MQGNLVKLQSCPATVSTHEYGAIAKQFANLISSFSRSDKSECLPVEFHIRMID